MFQSKKKPDYVGSNKIIFLNKGMSINIKGEADKSMFDNVDVQKYAVQPGNFRGVVPIPKVVVNIGDKVKAGDLLFYDKKKPYLKFISPVSGTVTAINRGLRRSIKEVVVEKDKDLEYRKFNTPDLSTVSREDLVGFLTESGLWPLIRQRPYDLVPEIEEIPRDIFITTFDSSPLAPDYDYIITGNEDAFQKGLDVLSKLTKGKVYLGLNANKEQAPSQAFIKAEGVEKTFFKGPHPSGNVGIHVHHLAPIKGNQKIWILGIQEVVTIGNMFLKNIYDASRIIAIAGEDVDKPRYLKTYMGADISESVRVCVKDAKCRVISGNVLTGETKEYGEFLNAFDYLISIIPEGNYFEPFGWLIPKKSRPSFSRSFLSKWIFPKKKYNIDTNMHGQERAFVATGIYKEVLPMDIYPVHLMKAILAGDIEKMEGLGINEVSEEDVALCEFICPSKQEFQAILRDGHRMMIEQ
ncbi:MAG TPA: Na(+)-translocating NADH-quinone reductase subunit A [Bacteroidetes bacterium]|nr:Na(+)-translocating NADH-quinone reductase subunit A [Bacteroidota bacterium]